MQYGSTHTIINGELHYLCTSGLVLYTRNTVLFAGILENGKVKALCNVERDSKRELAQDIEVLSASEDVNETLARKLKIISRVIDDFETIHAGPELIVTRNTYANTLRIYRNNDIYLASVSKINRF